MQLLVLTLPLLTFALAPLLVAARPATKSIVQDPKIVARLVSSQLPSLLGGDTTVYKAVVGEVQKLHTLTASRIQAQFSYLYTRPERRKLILAIAARMLSAYIQHDWPREGKDGKAPLDAPGDDGEEELLAGVIGDMVVFLNGAQAKHTWGEFKDMISILAALPAWENYLTQRQELQTVMQGRWSPKRYSRAVQALKTLAEHIRGDIDHASVPIASAIMAGKWDGSKKAQRWLGKRVSALKPAAAVAVGA